jgi:ribonucleoside-diphosphate reductase alpha chain
MSVRALAEYTRVAKYARYLPEKKRRETWNEQVERVFNMHRGYYKSILEVDEELQEAIDFAEKMVLRKRVLGSQRALQFGGDPILKKNERLYNCFHEDTKFVTKFGTKKFSDFKDGDKTVVLTHEGNWKPATIKSYGKQELIKITIGRGGSENTVFATEDHTWILSDGSRTTSLKPNDSLMFGPDISEFDYDDANPMERLYWCYGYVYGDGTKIKDKNGEYKYSMVRLCGKDTKFSYRFSEMGFDVSTNNSLNGDFFAYTGKYLKNSPDPKKDDVSLIKAFVRGYLDADGTKDRSYKNGESCGTLREFASIQSSEEDHIEFIRNCFPIAGYYIVSEEDLTGQETNFGVRGHTIKFRIINRFGKTAQKFRVKEMEKYCIDTVWCLEVEDDHSFVLPFGAPTGNCSATYVDRPRVFQEAMFLLLCGCGVGFSLQKHHVKKLPKITKPLKAKKTFVIPDTIEGWADACGVLVSAYFDSNKTPFPEFRGIEVKFDYSKIRPKGSPLSSGAKAPGPDGLRESLEAVEALLDRCVEERNKLRPIDAYDILMHLSNAVLSGGVRRSATICLFSPDDNEMATAKTGDWFVREPQRARSNNSALLIRDKTTKEEFKSLMQNVKEFGEPGFVWADDVEALFNPCCEIGLYAYDEKGNSGVSFCNLCEINMKKTPTEADFYDSCKAAAILGTLQAGYTHFPYLGEVSEEIVKREALLGVSMTGMMDSPDIAFNAKIQKQGARIIKAVNEKIAKILGINAAARLTCVKPSGTASCILGTSSGIHPHHSSRYLRRVQANKIEAPVVHFQKTNPLAVEQSVWKETDLIITFVCEIAPGAKAKNNLSAIEMLENVKLTQNNWVRAGTIEKRCVKDWSIHNVSNTITVKEDEWKAVTDYIWNNRRYFSGISLLPASGDKDFPQAPFASILTEREIVQEYGEGSLFASGLIEYALVAFDGNLWKACDFLMGINGIPNKTDAMFEFKSKCETFANKYLERNLRKLTYLLKDVYNRKLFLDLSREYKDVDWSTMIEEKDDVDFGSISACSGGVCELGKLGEAMKEKLNKDRL